MAREVYNRANNCLNPVNTFADIVINTITELTNTKYFQFRESDGSVSKMMASAQKFAEEVERIPEKIFADKEIMTASLFMVLTDAKTREKIKKEMADSIFKDDLGEDFKKGYCQEERKVLYPDLGTVFKIRYDMEQEENSEKNYTNYTNFLSRCKKTSEQ